MIGLQACQPQINAPLPHAGELDFSQYIAVGNSITAGYTNDGLYESAQKLSYPMLLSTQFSQLGGKKIHIPLAAGNGSGYIVLDSFTASGCPHVLPTPEMNGIPEDVMWEANISGQGPFENLGMFGMTVGLSKSIQMSAINHFFGRIVPNPGELNYEDLVEATDPTFFSMWLGTEDALLWASEGGTHFLGITEPSVFATNYEDLITAISGEDHKVPGILINIPDVSSLPYFTAVKIRATDPHTCQIMPVFVKDASGEVREAQLGDYILLEAGEKIGKLEQSDYAYGLHPENPVPDKLVLDKGEAEIVSNAIKQYNQIILEKAVAYGFAHLDINSLMNKASVEGLMVDGIRITEEFLVGGVFSLDGFHTTPRGNALIANECLKEINDHYKARIPLLNIAEYQGVVFP